MIFAVDLDGVCYHWERTARYLLRTERGYASLIYPSTDWDYIRRMVEREDWQWLWTEGVKLGLFRYGHVVTGAIEGVRALQALGKVVFVTHRPATAVQDTLDWLSYARFKPSGIHVLSGGESKTVVPADVYIDDKPENITDVVAHTEAHGVLFDQPWNQGAQAFDDSPRFHRAKGWPAAVDIVKRIKTQGRPV